MVKSIISILMVFALFVVLFILGFGIFSMAKGGDFALKYGNRLMRLRIIAQAAALLIFALLLFLWERA